MENFRADCEPADDHLFRRPVLRTPSDLSNGSGLPTLVVLLVLGALTACGGPEVEGRSVDAWLHDATSDAAPVRNRAVTALGKHPEAFADAPDRLESLLNSSHDAVRELGARVAITLLPDDAAAVVLTRAVCTNRVPGATHGRAVLALTDGPDAIQRRFATELLRSIDSDPEAARRTLQLAIREDSFDRDLRNALMRTLATKSSDRRPVVRTVIEAITRIGGDARGLEPFVERTRNREATHMESARALGSIGGAESFTRLLAWLAEVEHTTGAKLSRDVAIDSAETLDALSACVRRGDLSGTESSRLREIAEPFLGHRESRNAAAGALAASVAAAPLTVDEARIWWLQAASPSLGRARTTILEVLADAVREGSFEAFALLNEEAIDGPKDVTGALEEWFELLPTRQILRVIEHDRDVGVVRAKILSCAAQVALDTATESPDAGAARDLVANLLRDPAWRGGPRWTARVTAAHPGLTVESWPDIGSLEEAARALAKADPTRFRALIERRREGWRPGSDEASLRPAEALLGTALEFAPELALLPLGSGGTSGTSASAVRIVVLTLDDRENAPGPSPGQPMLWTARSALRLERLLPASWPETTGRAWWLDQTSRVLAEADDPRGRPATATAVLLQAEGETPPDLGIPLPLWNELLRSTSKTTTRR